jgi:sarcosine oxidase subunit alpha
MSHTATPSGPAGLYTDPGQPLTFSFEDRSIPAVAGQSIAAALYASGVRVFTRSFKYHRPRGLFCVAGDCPNCLMQVDGRPNVRACVEPARQGQVVRSQNAWPGLGFDLLRTFDRLDRFLPVGFYYKSFHRPRWLWPLFEHVVRHVAGLGSVDALDRPELETAVEHLHADVCVVGAGPAGLTAATEAAAAGANVLLLDREPRPGGHLLYRGGGLSEVDELLQGLHAQPRARLLGGTTVFGLYEGNLLGAFRGSRLLKVRARQVVVCTGGRQKPFVFHNNDLPGIFLGRGALRLARLYGIAAGRRAVVLTDNDDGERLAKELASLGVEIAAVVDRRARKAAGKPKVEWPTLAGSAVLAARGNTHLKAVRVAEVRGDGRPAGAGQEVACDLLLYASALVPANELLYQGGMRFRHERGRWLPDKMVAGLAGAGAVAGTFEQGPQILEGRLRGAEAAAALGYRVAGLAGLRRDWEARRGAPFVLELDSFLPQAEGSGHKRFVCLCEDVTEKDVEQAVAEGFDNIETLKRYSTANMGPCQGKMCGQAVIEACARLTGRDVNAVGTTTSRPPVVPVELGVLAAERAHQPARRTPLHHWHEAAGARWLDAGLWKRPESYGDPAAEVRAVRGGAGLIDVSTLGKIELVGADAVELLERVCLNRWADLKVGRARYQAMCNEDGILFDDGVAGRLGPHHFYLTATTGNAEAVFQWLQLWRATWGFDVVLVNQTATNAAVNLAGPRSREVLGKLTGLDLSPAAFPYMALRQAEVAGVPCHLFRIGFVGELGYEIHCPAACAWHLWEALLRAGADVGIRPFGVEAQRVLRLEKGHLIVGQDTDALSNPLEAGLEWLVRFDKPYFHGRETLLRLESMVARSRLVGFFMLEGQRVPPEGCQVVEQGRPVGRVTSARHSPTLGRGLGLAWVPAARSAVGERFLIRWNGADGPAVVAAVPFYDPQGTRLRDS